MTNIFYGISSVNNVRNNIDRWIAIAGEPEVFAEKPENFDPRGYMKDARTWVEMLVDAKIKDVLGSANSMN